MATARWLASTCSAVTRLGRERLGSGPSTFRTPTRRSRWTRGIAISATHAGEERDVARVRGDVGHEDRLALLRPPRPRSPRPGRMRRRPRPARRRTLDEGGLQDAVGLGQEDVEDLVLDDPAELSARSWGELVGVEDGADLAHDRQEFGQELPGRAGPGVRTGLRTVRDNPTKSKLVGAQCTLQLPQRSSCPSRSRTSRPSCPTAIPSCWWTASSSWRRTAASWGSRTCPPTSATSSPARAGIPCCPPPS